MKFNDKRRNVAPDRSRKGEERASRIETLVEDMAHSPLMTLKLAEMESEIMSGLAKAKLAFDTSSLVMFKGRSMSYTEVIEEVQRLKIQHANLAGTNVSRKERRKEERHRAHMERKKAQARLQEEAQRVKTYGEEYGSF